MNAFDNFHVKKKIDAAILYIFIVIYHLTSVKYIDSSLDVVFLFISCLACILFTKNWQLLYCLIFFFLSSLSEIIPGLWIHNSPQIKNFLLISLSTIAVFPVLETASLSTWLKMGRIDIFTSILIIITGIFSSSALIIWANWTDNLGMAVQMVESVKHYPILLILLLGIPIFAVVNAALEEIIFRGILQGALTNTFQSIPLIIILQATLFAAYHFVAGFPNGIIGYLMVLIYGIMLGYLRKHTNGMLSPFIAHIIADLTIFYYMAINFL